MERLLVECAVRGTLIAGGTAAVLWAARIKAPAVLHAVWTGVVVSMLLLPLWTVWGPKASMPVLTAAPASVGVFAGAPVPIDRTSVQSADLGPRPIEQSTPARTTVWNWRGAAMSIYGLVAGVLLLRLASGTVRTRRLVRGAVLHDARLTSAACASPVTMGWLRPVVILPECWGEWSAPQLDAVLAHEREHVRRRDPLVQWIALLNRAVFWFHPVAWWLERRLAALAEQTCDDAVLAHGHDPRDYSEYLLDTARAVSRGARVNLAGVFMPGSFLPQRIRRMLDGSRPARVSRARLACAVAACAMSAVLCAVAAPVRAASQAANPSRMVVRPLHPRWIPPESTLPQPMSLPWMDGDEWTFQVQSIITNQELTAYSELQTPQQRDAFIARFWVSRDPSANTPANEFRDEYTRRVEFGSEHFSGSGQQGFGFDTDRGRVYLMFGAPDAIDTQAAAADRYEVWRYVSVPEMGPDFKVRFSLGREQRLYCGYRISSSAPHATAEGVATNPVDQPVPHASVKIYPLGLTEIFIPVDPARVVGARWELHTRSGVPADDGQLGSMDERGSNTPLSQYLPADWLDMGIGCTHALPADTYTLTTAVRFTTGQTQREAVTFDVR